MKTDGDRAIAYQRITYSVVVAVTVAVEVDVTVVVPVTIVINCVGALLILIVIPIRMPVLSGRLPSKREKSVFLTSIYVYDGIGFDEGVDVDLKLVDLGCDNHLHRGGTCRAGISLQIQAHSRRSREKAE